MAEVTAGMVKDLRERTGAGMMDCKSALAETKGDVEEAIDLLRKKGLAKAAKKSGRVAAEGLVGVATSGTKGAVVEVNSETDFVARNDLFQDLVTKIAGLALELGGDLERVASAPFPGAGAKVSEQVSNLVAKIGENMNFRRTAALSVNSGLVSSYIHSAIAPGLGKIGVLVALESTGKTDALSELGKAIAMHVAAANPQALDSAGLDPQVVARERGVIEEKAKATGKPANVIEKIVESGLKTFYKEVTLLEQPYVHDDKKTVGQAVKDAAGKVGAPVTIKGFVRFALGEGVEKPEGPDFASEVKAAAKV
jgi:elongation factor Ts